jgi:putative dimethyl sulfoxide reductase chaperone
MNPDDALTRSQLYLSLADLFDYPDAAFHTSLTSGDIATSMRPLLDAVCPELSHLAAQLRVDTPLDQLTADYSFLFDVGNSGKPPCPLFGGAYGGGDRMKVMEEALRFYHHFGLRLDEHNHDMPDQLRTQLEFLHFLAYRQSESILAGEDSAPYLRAEHDFLERHPGHWIPLMHSRLKESGNVSVYRAAVALLDGVIHRLSPTGREE